MNHVILDLPYDRHPGDGEEEPYTLDNHILTTSATRSPNKNNASSVKQLRKPLSSENLLLISNTPNSRKTSLNISESLSDLTSYISPPLSPNLNESSVHDLNLAIDTLRTKLKLCEEHNSQLIEEKLRLSQQLGVQTQVNNEVKKLLVASIGEDLEEK